MTVNCDKTDIIKSLTLINNVLTSINKEYSQEFVPVTVKYNTLQECINKDDIPLIWSNLSKTTLFEMVTGVHIKRKEEVTQSDTVLNIPEMLKILTENENIDVISLF